MRPSLINYPQWQGTADTLHLILQIIGKVKLERCYPRPEWAQIRQYLTADGLTTGLIPGDHAPFEIILNLRQHHIEVRSADGKLTLIPLKNSVTVAEYYQQLMDALAYIGSPTTLNVRSVEFREQVDLDKDNEQHTYHEHDAMAYLDTLLFAHRVQMRFLSPYRGKSYMPAFYFGTMDLSCSLFSGEAAPFPRHTVITYYAFDERLCEFGFWTGDVNMPAPSFYVMPYPFLTSLDGHEAMLRPDKAIFLPERKEFFLTLEDAMSYKDPEEKIIEFFRTSFEIQQKIDRWKNIEWITQPLEEK